METSNSGKERKVSSIQNRRISANALACRRKFLRFFPKGFDDDKYVAWERGYKWQAHERWEEQLNRTEFQSLLKNGEFGEIAARAVKIESPTNLLFSFEKMALRDAVKSEEGAKIFAEDSMIFCTARANRNVNSSVGARRSRNCQKAIESFDTSGRYGFRLSRSTEKHIFLNRCNTRRCAEYGLISYKSNLPGNLRGLLEFAELIKQDLADLKPRDMIDVQSFIWVQGSSEYEED